MQPLFSIIVVSLNSGEKLKNTLESIISQSCRDYEIIVKDGLSQDDSTEAVKKLQEGGQSLKLIEKKDSGIYDAMNQAVQEAKGSYIYFLNCGDFFYHKDVLQEISDFIKENPSGKGIYYGNIFERLTGQVVFSNPRMDTFGCYRNVPCHQACFYAGELLIKHPFHTEYRVRADYEHFLWCFFQAQAECLYMELLIADYEGGGFSETGENRRLSAKEHKKIVRQYMSRGKVLCYRMILWITLAPLRTRLAGNEKTAGVYNKIKKMLYQKKQ